ncbi:MAG: hypothetical protein NY202_02340 [Mollicutes bacterium UO1]
MKLKNILCCLRGAVACDGVCIATGTLAATAILGYSAAAGGLGFFVGDKADKESIEREKELLKDKRYKDAADEVNKQTNENTRNQDLIDTIIGKINGNIPCQTHETDEYLNNQLIVVQNNLKNGEGRLKQLRSDVDKRRKELGG